MNGTRPLPVLILVGRSYCHLCDVMRDDLLACSDLPDFELVERDVDADPDLMVRFDELVPVLLTKDQRILCQYRFDSANVREYLQRFE